jgi:uncharacterized protein (TIGR03435 family)
MQKGFVGAGFVVLIAYRVFAQSATLPSFEVASVKLSRPGPRGFSPTHLAVEPGGQRFTATIAPLRSLIIAAYHITDLQISGGPAWIDSDAFDVEAKAERPTDNAQIYLMLQTLLADRFHLMLHREMKELPVEALVAGKGGLKLEPATAGAGKPGISFRRAGTRDAITITGQSVTLPFIAEYLSGRLHRIVVDKTGLAGSFDFSAELAIDRDDVNDPNVSERDNVAHMFADLPQKIGLKLQPQKVLMETFTVEHAEKPAEN